MRIADYIAQEVARTGTASVFMLSGGMMMHLMDAFGRQPGLKYYCNFHEQACAMAADAYARQTGKLGVCLATSGPGATNLVTGIANAYLDSIPLVAITGQVRADLIGTDAFQEADVTGITLPIVKHSYLVQSAAEIPRVIHEAFHIASTGRPGPVVIDVPVTAELAELTYKAPDSLQLAGYKPTVKGHVKQIRAAARAILEAERPVLYVGGGVISAGASDELHALSDLVQAPVTTTLMGLGAFDERLPLSLGMLGMHGTVPANYAVHECDVLIGIGVRFDDRVTGKLSAFAPQARTIIHIDVDPAEIGKNVEPSIPIVGDARHVLAALLAELQKAELVPGRTAPWLAKIAAWQDEFRLHYEQPAAQGVLAPQFVIQEIERITGGEAVIVTDVGQHQMWSTLYFDYRFPRQWISSGGLGTMGFGLPAAIGAKLGRPDKTVIDISGDGGFQMTMQELATAVNYDIPVVVCILNNGYLGMVRQWQDLFWNKRYSQTCIAVQPDFVMLAEAFGAKGLRVTEPEHVGEALREALDSGRPTVIDFKISPEENVFPMVPAGQSITELIGGKASRKTKGAKP